MRCEPVLLRISQNSFSTINQKAEDILLIQNSKTEMTSIHPCSLLDSCSAKQSFNKQLELSQTELQAKIKLEETSEQKYKIKLKDSFILLYPLNEDQQVQLACLPLDFDIKMSKLYKENKVFTKAQTQPQGIKLENQKGESVSFYFNSPNQVYIWVKKLSLYVNQLHFQRLYKPVRKLGKGASAAVYEVRRLEDGKKFAAKVFPKQKFSKTYQLLQTLKREVEILRVLSCQEILAFQGIFQNEFSYFLIMELIKGLNVYDFLMLQKTKLQKQEICLIMRNIMKNLVALEQLDIIHRDIKLENIIIDSISLQTKVIDYGLAVYSEEDDYIQYNCGTPGYLSPEIVSNNNKNKITTKSDIFSAGIVFHVLLTGAYVFAAKNPKQMLANNLKMQIDLSLVKSKDIDPSAIDLLEKMLALSPEDRFSASQCLDHQFLKEYVSEDDQKPNTPSTEGDNQQMYQF